MAGDLTLPSHNTDLDNDFDVGPQAQTNGVLTDAQFNAILANPNIDPALFMDTDAESSHVADPVEFDTDMNQIFGQFPGQYTIPSQIPTAPAAGYMPAPPTMPQNPIPNMAMGPSWNPHIGWYYPVVPSAALPQPPAMPFSIAGTPFVPMPTTNPDLLPQVAPQVALQDAAQEAPRAPAAAKSKGGRKRKYGPAAYLEKQGTNPTPDARNVSVTEADYTSKAKQRDERGQTKPRRAGTTRKKKRLSIIQACICPDKSMITRPKNAFILYRSSKAPEIFKALDKKDNRSVSKIAGQWWANESDQVKAEFKQKAAQETERHKAMHPGYHYEPGLAQRNRFGFPNCTCGAYQVNWDHMMTGLNMAPTVDAGYAANESEADYRHEMQGPSMGFAQLPQPQVPMAVSRGYSTASAYGLGVSTQQTGTQASTNGLKRKRDATSESNEADSSIARRLRSNRATGINYTEPDEYDIFDPAAYADNLFGPAQPPMKKRRPSPINTSAAQPELVQFNTSPSQQVISLDDSPARNTRSKSRASLELEEIFTAAAAQMTAADGYAPGDFDFSMDLNAGPEIDWGQWGAMPLEGDDDNIVVTSRRSSSRSRGRRSSKKSPATSAKSTSPTERYPLRSKSRSQR